MQEAMWFHALICLMMLLCNFTAASRADKNLDTRAADANVVYSFSDAAASASVIRVIGHTAQIGIDSMAVPFGSAVMLLLAIPIVIVLMGTCSDREAEDDAWESSECHVNPNCQRGIKSPNMTAVPGPPAPPARSPCFGNTKISSPQDKFAVLPCTDVRCSPVPVGRKDSSPLQVFGGKLVPLLKSDDDDSARSSGSQSPVEFPSELLLCPGLVVKQPGGVTLKMQGLCAPYKQSAMLDVSRTNRNGNPQVVARVNISECANGGGVVLESASRSPLAFLYTEHAVSKEGDPPPSDRYITASSVSPIANSSMAEPQLFTIKADGANEGFVMRRGPPPGEAMLLLVRVHGDGLIVNVVDIEGKLLAATEARESSGNICQPIRLLHIAHGVDAGLILVAIIAAQKLS